MILIFNIVSSSGLRIREDAENVLKETNPLTKAMKWYRFELW